ncbi:hypothetical protein M409DRAFT_30460 [Zasmidium cellare ATCC 36951]|uniref:Uncharacterized protein n=1 Tax=Zasmidium cellare ATCC 36951 TaxID=1080233 RepID=A0A6A6BZM6_ZASCE|nr:uncharacterized protein M409DRAFT_30460 [Zasmidium cellare ATCC 36951]KAF2159042.1 hypothetical protein M409DRAFT_30460 [Zasmidium cellare ATCC 36951]
MVVDSLALRYAHYAIASYQAFSRHKAAETIPSSVRLQVSLPLPKTLVVEWIKPEYQEMVETQYKAAIVRAIEGIQGSIPHQDLAIQIDCRLTSPDFEMRTAGSEIDDTLLLASCAARLARYIAADVELGLHIASSSPGTTQSIVDMAKAVRRQCSKPVAWMHLSLPPDTTNEQSLLPLEDLAPDRFPTKTELVLGLVLPRDEEGSRRRLFKAAERLGTTDFGISAACNLVDLTQDDFKDVLRILRVLSMPHE